MPRQPAAPPKPRWRPRFSLLSLLCGVVLLASAGGLYARWEPWVLQGKLPSTINSSGCFFSPDSRWCGAMEMISGKPETRMTLDVFDLQQTPLARVFSITHDITRRLRPAIQLAGGRVAVSPLAYDGRKPLHLVHDLGLNRRILETTMLCHSFLLSPDGRLLAVMPEANPTTLLLQPPESTAEPAVLPHESQIDRVLFGANAQLITIAGQHLHYWDTVSHKLLRKVPFAGDAFNCQVSPGGTRLLYFRNDLGIVLDLQTGAELSRLPTAYDDTGVFLGDERCLLLSHTSWGAQLWDFDNGAREILPKIKLGTVQSSRNGDRWLCSIDEVHSKIAVFDSQTFAPVYQFLPQNIWTFNALAPDGETVVLSTNQSESGLAPDDPSCGAFVYRRRRPEQWWGLFWLPESWLGLAALSGLLVSISRASKNKTRAAPEAPPASEP